MFTIDVSDSERRHLKDYKRKAKQILVQAKAEAVLLASRGVDWGTIADFVDRKESTVAQWLREWSQARMASIVTGHAGNLNASKLTAAQRSEVQSVLAQPPSDVGLPDGFWSVPALAAWLDTRFEVTYESASSYQFLLRFAGLSFHQPQPFDKRRAPDPDIDARMDAIREQIAPALADPDHLVFAADETRLCHEAITRRAWYAKGTKTKLLVDRERDAQSYLGFLDQNTGDCHLHALSWQNGTTIAAALRDLVADNPGKKITIIWDNAAFHRAKEIRDLLGEGNPLENIHLIWLPPYAPDHNPIEHVWKDAKDNIANFQRVNFDQTCEAFETHIANRKFKYTL